jgi:hypothetical protein
MHRFAEFSAALILCAGLAASARAQRTGGNLEIHVTDDSGAVIPGADIAVTGPAGPAGKASADAEGKYVFTGLPGGSYKVRVSWTGFASGQAAAANVAPGQTAVLNVALHIQAAEQKVTVSAEAPEALSTDPAANAGALVLTGADLEALPDDPDELMADLRALAGPGAGLGDMQLFVDGFSGGRLPSKESIREIRINQNPFSAEYDRVGFGRTEIFTKPGSDQFHGMGFFKFSDGMLNSRNPYAPFKPPYQNRQFGGNVGGPLGKKASIFLDAERRAIDDNAVINAMGLDSAFHIAPFRTALTAPQAYSNLSARVDYQLTEKNTLVSRVNWWNSDNQNAGVGGFSLASTACQRAQNGYSLQLTDTAVLSATAINETRFQVSRASIGQTGANSGPAIVVLDAFNGGSPLDPNASDVQNRFELQNYTSLSLGPHLLKFGGRVRGVSLTDSSIKGFGGEYVFAGGTGPALDAANQVIPDASGNPVSVPLTSIERYQRTLLFANMGLDPAQIRALGGGPSHFLLTGGQPAMSLAEADAGLYIQDDWRVRPNFSLSAGLRWEVQTGISDMKDFAPRLGFAWAPGRGKHAKTVIRGGAGIFYDRFGENLLLDAMRFNGVTQRQYVVRDPNFFPNVPAFASMASTGLQPVVHSIQPGLRAPYVIETSLGVERQLPLKLVLGVNYINTHGVHLLRSRDINAQLPNDPGARPFAGGGNFMYESSGLLNQNQLITSVTRRFGAGLSLFGYYAYGRAFSNTDGPGTFPMSQYNLAGEYGRAAMDIRHQGVIGASFLTPLGLRLSPFLLARSGAPFDIVTGHDLTGDGIFTARPAFAADPLAAGVVMSPWGMFNLKPGPGAVTIPRNYGQGPGYFTLNFRLSKTFGFGGTKEGGGHAAGGKHGAGGLQSAESGLHNILRDGSTGQRYNLTLSIQVRNILNYMNPGIPVGNLSSPLFGMSTWLASAAGPQSVAAGDNRRIQFQLRFGF